MPPPDCSTWNIARFAEIVLAENKQQNLIAASTVNDLATRHIEDSLQLLPLAALQHGLWIDIGSGAGFPGMIAAICRETPTLLVEPRTRRADFLDRAAATLGIADRVEVARAKAQAVKSGPAAVISARAVAPLADLFAMAHHLADASTLWLLPKGRNAQAEVAAARATWQAEIELVPSITDSAAAIVVARNVRPARRPR